MSAAALKVYGALRAEGTQKNVLDLMQTRNELYDVLGYHAYEQQLDRLYAGKKAASNQKKIAERKAKGR
jgi:methylisocitrate lyase